MIVCKKCGSEKKNKNGIVRGKQKYLYKECGCVYIESDRRTNEKIKAKKSLIILLSGLGDMSMRMIAKILGTWPSLVSYWLVETGAKLPADRITDDIKEVKQEISRLSVRFITFYFSNEIQYLHFDDIFLLTR